MGSLWVRQNALLHNAHVAAGARGGLSPGEDEDSCEERGMIVLFVKQVHLQKEGGESAITNTISAYSTESK